MRALSRTAAAHDPLRTFGKSAFGKAGIRCSTYPLPRFSEPARFLPLPGAPMKLFQPFGGFGRAGKELMLGREKPALTDRESLNSSFDADLNARADGVHVHPPVITRVQVLPFRELTWENFERLCYRLAGRAERVEHLARYGRSGQAQQGIDLFARMANGKYEVWQAKRYESIGASEVKAIVDTFRAGTWKDKSDRLVLAVQTSLADTKVQDQIEAQASALKAEGITFVPYGGDELSEILRGQPEVVDDFFGREWVEAFLGPEAAKAMSAPGWCRICAGASAATPLL